MSALALGSLVRRDRRATPLVKGANELAKLLPCVPASSESRIRSFETRSLCKRLHFNYHRIGIQKITVKQLKEK